MGAMSLIPSPDSIPVPWGWFEALLLGTFLCHLLLMNAVLGGGLFLLLGGRSAAPARMEAAPRMGTSINTEYIKGIGRQDGDFVIVLDIDGLFSSKELDVVREASQSSATLGQEKAA